MIITAGVIAAGIAVLYWAYSWGNVANKQYSEAIGMSQDAVKESIAFEYVHFLPSSNQLSVYLINCGKTDNVKIFGVYIYDSSSALIASQHTTNNDGMTLTLFDNSNTTSLDTGKEGYFIFNPGPLSPTSFFNIRIITERGRNYDYSFTTP